MLRTYGVATLIAVPLISATASFAQTQVDLTSLVGAEFRRDEVLDGVNLGGVRLQVRRGRGTVTEWSPNDRHSYDCVMTTLTCVYSRQANVTFSVEIAPDGRSATRHSVYTWQPERNHDEPLARVR